MAVAVRLSARGAPRRMAAACFPIVSEPRRAFGGWTQRVTATNGTVPQPARPNPAAAQVFQQTAGSGGKSSGAFANPIFAPQWSIVRPSLPHNAPWAGHNTHGIPGQTYTLAIGQPVQGQTVKTQMRPGRKIYPKVPVAAARVTTAPRPLFRWKRQGG